MNKKMKSLLIVLVLFTLVVNAQRHENKELKEEITNYVETNITPELVVQQNKYLTYLSENEKEQLTEIKERVDAYRQKRQQHRQSGSDTIKGNQQKQQRHQHQAKGQRDKVHAEVEKIIANYPDASADYAVFIYKNKDTWVAEIEALRKQYGVGDSSGNRKMRFFDHMSDPVWLLVWNPEKPLLRR